MGTEFLVAGLWGIVLVYWFWSRRPSTADTVGVFRRELRVLEGATPARVAPANRRCAGEPAAVPAPVVAAAAACHKRMKQRRRRRDVLVVLLVAVIVSAVSAVVTRSTVAFGSQAACDVVLFAYVSLLVLSTRASLKTRDARPLAARAPVAAMAASTAWTSDVDMPVAAAQVVAPAPGRARAPRRRPAAQAEVASYAPAHALRQAVRRAVGDGTQSYGDFDSYASLALASAR